jgi:hypothetical protein
MNYKDAPLAGRPSAGLVAGSAFSRGRARTAGAGHATITLTLGVGATT